MTQLNLFSEAKDTVAEEVKIISAESSAENFTTVKSYTRLDGSVTSKTVISIDKNKGRHEVKRKQLNQRSARNKIAVSGFSGQLAEELFQVHCTRNGKNHYTPSSPCDIVDCIANFHGGLQRVQIKFNTPVSHSSDKKNYSRFEGMVVPLSSSSSGTSLADGSRSRKIYYSKKNIDKLIVFNPITELFYDIPIPTEEELKYYTDVMKKTHLSRTFTAVSREDYYNVDLWEDKRDWSSGNRGKYKSYGVSKTQILFLEDFLFDINAEPDPNETSLYSPEMMDPKIRKIKGHSSLFPPRWRGVEINFNPNA